MDAPAPRASPSSTSPRPVHLARSPYSRQVVARQTPRCFWRKAVRPSRVFVQFQNSFGMVSQPSISIRSIESALPSELMLTGLPARRLSARSEEHTSELQSLTNLVCRLLLEKKKTTIK